MNNVVALKTNEVYEDIMTFLKDVKNNSENTYKRYRRGIELFFEWHAGKDLYHLTKKDIMSINYNTMKQYRVYLKQERNNSNSTINNNLSVLYSLFRELRKIDGNKYNISLDELHLKRLDQSDEEHYGDITWEESEQMIKYLKSLPPRKMPEVKSTLVHIARMTGIRLTGLLNLKYKDLKREYGLWVIHHSIKGKKHSQAIRDEDAEKLFALRENENDPEEKIFKISSKTVERMMDEVIEELGFDKSRNITFHSIRRLYGEEVYAATGNDILITQQFLGHSNTETTRNYVERKQHILNSPALYIGQDIDISLVKDLEKEDWQKIFSQLSRSTQYEILGKIKQLNADHFE